MAAIELFNRQERHSVDLGKLGRFSEQALTAAREVSPPAGGPWPLGELERIEVTIVDDDAIADVHEKFMNVPGPTDVITFDHGEILISADTAAEQGREFLSDLNREIGLYLVHGLLHLAGYDDKMPDEAAEMKALQEEILARIWE